LYFRSEWRRSGKISQENKYVTKWERPVNQILILGPCLGGHGQNKFAFVKVGDGDVAVIGM